MVYIIMVPLRVIGDGFYGVLFVVYFILVVSCVIVDCLYYHGTVVCYRRWLILS